MRLYDCCDHCEHDINDPPHNRPCPEGCEDDSASWPGDGAGGGGEYATAFTVTPGYSEARTMPARNGHDQPATGHDGT